MSTRDLQSRALAWIGGSESQIGSSSKCIWRTMMGTPEPEGRGGSYPLDPDDFNRCRKLFALIPEWRERVSEMAVHGPVWTRLADEWDEIETMFISEVGDMPTRGAKAPGTYALMRDIIDRPAPR